MTKREMDIYLENEKALRKSLEISQQLVDQGHIKTPFDRILTMLTSAAEGKVIRPRGKGTLAGLALAIAKALEYEKQGEEPSEVK